MPGRCAGFRESGDREDSALRARRGFGRGDVLVQQSGGAVKEIARLPIGLRMENALVSYAIYCLKTIWPSGLAVFYPYPPGFEWWIVVAAGWQSPSSRRSRCDRS